jgi:hypothetical protein
VSQQIGCSGGGGGGRWKKIQNFTFITLWENIVVVENLTPTFENLTPTV